jgi:5-methylcytosine-specific restriction protein A
MHQLSDLSIFTIRRHESITEAIKVGSIRFAEKANWKTGAELLDNAKRSGQKLVVLLGDSTNEQKGIMAWGVAKAIIASRSETEITLEEVKSIPSRPVVWSLWCESTGERLSEEDQRNYRIVRTPEFLLHEPKTFVLTWNPAKQIPISDFENIHAEICQGVTPERYWTCRSFNKVRAGDRFLMLRQGEEPKGIVGSGLIRSDGWRDDDGTPYVDILWTHAVRPDRPLAASLIRGAESFHWTPQGSGIGMEDPIASAVWNAWAKHVKNTDKAFQSTQSAAKQTRESGGQEEEITVDTAASVEGRLVESWSSRRERDPKNRERCIKAYGPQCAVCDMTFLEEYGIIGDGFIHVHHENPLGGVASDGIQQDAIKDLRPVCPNCHAMLHRGLDASKGEVRPIAELRAIRARLKRVS